MKKHLKKNTLEKGMARQGCSKDNRVGEALLQNVGTVHYSPFTRPVNSLLFHWSPFIITISEFTQNLVKSLGVQGHLCCSEGSSEEDNVGNNNCSEEGSSKYGSVGKGNDLEKG
jgi:hypothetical protein